MGQILIRQINDEALAGFRDRARREGMSAEAFARKLIETEARRMTREEALKRMDELRAMTPRSIESSVDLIRQLREENDNSH
jgi:plasmid stability protein